LRSTPAAANNTQSAKCCCPACVGLECLDRTRFFAGQLLTESDLNNEQSYWLAKSRLHNRFLHGWGVACGLQVVCSECDGWVNIEPGYAIDPCGNDIIVCKEQPFNVLKAIQACCAPQKTSNCSPLRNPPPPTCQDTIQHWCIFIEYQEQPSRLVTALQQTQTKTCSCGCGGNCGCGGHGKNGGGCGCGGHKNGASKTKTTTTSTVPAGACEATRILEGFTIGVCAEQESSFTTGVDSQLQQCLLAAQKVLQQAPDFTSTGISWTAQTAFQAACNYLLTVRNFLASVSLLNCTSLDTVNGIVINPIGPNQTLPDYLFALSGTIATLKQQVTLTVLNCICFALLPPCPADPCDNRVCLACVSVQNGKIINVCNFGCRCPVITFPTVHYWLSLFGFDAVLAQLTAFLERICCGVSRDVGGVNSFSPRENFTTFGISNSGMVNRALSGFVTQMLGATVINAANPQANTIDLRPLVGQSSKNVTVALAQMGISNVTTTAVDADPAWSDAAINAGAQFTPSAFSPQAPLTLFTKGELVVGFDVTNPTDVLAKQVKDLQNQINDLKRLSNQPQ
jgi:hypothetical protein